MSTVLIVSFSDLANDPRVNRQIRFLSGYYDVVAAGYQSPNISGIDFQRIGEPAVAAGPRPKNILLRKAQGALRLARAVVRRTRAGAWPFLGARTVLLESKPISRRL